MRRHRPSTPAPSPAGRAVGCVLRFAALGWLALTLGACQPPPATPAEAAAAALRAQGASDAQVQMQPDSFRAVLTQRDGRQSLVAVGIGTIGPADFGVPWYPRAEADPQRSSKLSGADGQVAATVLRTREPIERVLTFYRDRLSAGGALVREGERPGGARSFVVADEATLSATQVLVTPLTAGGTEVSLLTTRQAPK
jgi:hypothetical protein